jgi:hypothetical protein
VGSVALQTPWTIILSLDAKVIPPASPWTVWDHSARVEDVIGVCRPDDGNGVHHGVSGSA